VLTACVGILKRLVSSGGMVINEHLCANRQTIEIAPQFQAPLAENSEFAPKCNNASIGARAWTEIPSIGILGNEARANTWALGPQPNRWTTLRPWRWIIPCVNEFVRRRRERYFTKPLMAIPAKEGPNDLQGSLKFAQALRITCPAEAERLELRRPRA
jgi:hypothetical protein